jgi:E3 ubiquitin-protein ligase MARCH6
MGDNVWKRNFEMIIADGFTRINAIFILREVMIPLIIILLDPIMFPYFIGRSISVFLVSYQHKTILIRYSYLFYFAIRVVYYVYKYVRGLLSRLHNEIRDSRYLVGTELKNR